MPSTMPRSRCAKSTHYPPFGRLASIVVSGEDKHDTQSFARALARAAPLDDDVRVLGPAEAPLSLVRGRHRLRLLIKSPRAFDLSAYLRDWLAGGAETEGEPQARHRRRPAEFFVSVHEVSAQRICGQGVVLGH